MNFIHVPGSRHGSMSHVRTLGKWLQRYFVLKTRDVAESSLLNVKFLNLPIFYWKAFFVDLVTSFVGLGLGLCTLVFECCE